MTLDIESVIKKQWNGIEIHRPDGGSSSQDDRSAQIGTTALLLLLRQTHVKRAARREY